MLGGSPSGRFRLALGPHHAPSVVPYTLTLRGTTQHYSLGVHAHNLLLTVFANTTSEPVTAKHQHTP